ncbi:hypothetical protein GLA29479_3684 [Lysobacter antibioticus]|jgi:hypothetical protein|uniref:Uncharacterized protein n=1 Tax=Lysobacter antibioticus TaxID=84531 RepID=A0A0S2FCN7_LYSAN|nr:hypothetical protein [Lysobacter antibioticus]ALN64535.1 hypothetical protein GLA29479_3684 [Lysobacter antibioticus]ALN81320.1 hypothetical protein LA76x_3192 [Lysobacter antibioticus]
MTKSFIDEIGAERAQALVKEKVAEAIAEADALGLPQVVKIDGVWCRQYPDGRVEPVEGGQ